MARTRLFLFDHRHESTHPTGLCPFNRKPKSDRLLVPGKLGQYGEAIQHMNKYLALAPDAPDARAARDKIYVWQSGNDN